MDFRWGSRQGSQYQAHYFWLGTNMGLRVAHESRFEIEDISLSMLFVLLKVRAVDACSFITFSVVDAGHTLLVNLWVDKGRWSIRMDPFIKGKTVAQSCKTV
eukprot:1153223-Pelagomonas_calceolata.AAC.2